LEAPAEPASAEAVAEAPVEPAPETYIQPAMAPATYQGPAPLPPVYAAAPPVVQYSDPSPSFWTGAATFAGGAAIAAFGYVISDDDDDDSDWDYGGRIGTTSRMTSTTCRRHGRAHRGRRGFGRPAEETVDQPAEPRGRADALAESRDGPAGRQRPDRG
jgi:hypothetical protein